MNIVFHKHFRKRFAKLSEKVKDKFDVQLALFYGDTFDVRLRNHELHGKYTKHRSIDVTGDIRAVYRGGEREGDVIFVDIGTHSQLYS